MTFIHDLGQNKVKGETKMFLKSKIYFTVFVVYEIVAGFLLHYPQTCDPMFGGTFCMSGVFKYFVGLVAVPLLAYVIGVWIREIVLAVRRRRSIVYRTKNAVEDMWDNVKDRVAGNISKADIEKYLTAAVLVGIKKYVEKHPQAKNTLNNVIESLGGTVDEASDDDADYDDEDMDRTSSRRGNAQNRTRTQNANRKQSGSTNATRKRR